MIALLPRKDVPCHSRRLPPSPWCHGESTTSLLITSPLNHMPSATLYHSHIDMLVIVLYSVYCMRTLFHINTSTVSYITFMVTCPLCHNVTVISTPTINVHDFHLSQTHCVIEKTFCFFNWYVCTVPLTPLWCVSVCVVFRSFSCWPSVGHLFPLPLLKPRWICEGHTPYQSCSYGVLSLGSRQTETGSRRWPHLGRTGSPWL